MIAMSALALALLAAAPAPPGRILLCRSRVAGDEDDARRGAVAAAAHAMPGRFLDYGVVCTDIPEAVRAARRAGLEHALVSTVERKGPATTYSLSLSEVSSGREVAHREVAVAPGHDAVPPVRRALRDLLAFDGATDPGAGSRLGRER